MGETKHLPILVDVLNERIDKTTDVEYDYVEDNEVGTSVEHSGVDYTSFDFLKLLFCEIVAFVNGP